MPVQFDDTVFYDPALTAENADRYQAAKDQGRTGMGFLNNAYGGAQRGGSVGGPWGALGGAISEGLIGLIGGQKNLEKWRRNTPGPELAARMKAKSPEAMDKWKSQTAFGQGYAANADPNMPGGMQSEMGDWELPSNTEMA